MISIRDVEFRYPVGDFRLDVPELAISAGETVAVVGASGSGKSTLLALVAGILRPTSGTVLVRETEVSALDAAARRDFRLHSLGLVFQEFELLEHLDVRDNVLLAGATAAGAATLILWQFGEGVVRMLVRLA